MTYKPQGPFKIIGTVDGTEETIQDELGTTQRAIHKYIEFEETEYCATFDGIFIEDANGKLFTVQTALIPVS